MCGLATIHRPRLEGVIGARRNKGFFLVVPIEVPEEEAERPIRIRLPAFEDGLYVLSRQEHCLRVRTARKHKQTGQRAHTPSKDGSHTALSSGYWPPVDRDRPVFF